MYSIVLVEDHSIVRAGIKSVIEKSNKFSIIKTYESGHKALVGIKQLKPDFAIIDLGLPDLPGETLIKDLFFHDSKTKIIVLTRKKYIAQVIDLLKMNIFAYVIKDNAEEELLTALDEAHLGNIFLSPAIKEIMEKMGYTNNELNRKRPKKALTNREVEVARMLSNGYKSKEIAIKLSISLNTVRVHTKNIIKKLELESIKDFLKISKDLF